MKYIVKNVLIRLTLSQVHCSGKLDSVIGTLGDSMIN